MAGKAARSRGELEMEVLACLAAADQPMTAAAVQAAIGGLAYTTVMTTLARLHAKSALHRVPVGRAYAYSLVGGTDGARNNMAAHHMLKLLDVESDRAGVLARFVAELPPEDGELLARLIDGSGTELPPRRRRGR